MNGSVLFEDNFYVEVMRKLIIFTEYLNFYVKGSHVFHLNFNKILNIFFLTAAFIKIPLSVGSENVSHVNETL